MAQPTNTQLLTQIRDLIHSHFDLEEMRELCFHLGINYDDLRGETLLAHVRELVLRLDRERRLDDLLNFCAHLRPDVEWPDLSVPVDLDAAPAPFTVPQRNPRQIFLSHARQDAEFAHHLADDLRRYGWEIWIAPDSIRPGEKWVEAINRGLAESSVFLLAITPEATRSKWVHSETNVAIGLEHENVLRFIPLAVKTVDAPPLWRNYQWIPFQNDYQAGLEALLQELQPEMVAEVAGLYRQLQTALTHKEWVKAQTIAAQITVLYPDFRDTADLLAQARQASAHEQTRQAQADQLYPRLQTALDAAAWATALELAGQIEALIPDYRDVKQLAQHARRSQRQSQQATQHQWVRRIPIWGWGGAAFAGMVVLFLLFQSAWGGGARPTITPTLTLPAVAQMTPESPTPSKTPSATPTPTSTQTATPSRTPSPTPTIDPHLPPTDARLGDEWTRPQDGMVMVYVPPPDAPLVLGSGVDAPLEGYWIDKYEVSNAQYQLCVDAAACEPSAYADSALYHGADYPVVGVSWFDAADYSDWLTESLADADGWTYDLPTEAEWEYAAVGDAGTAYPWGDEFDGARLNFCDANCPTDQRNIAWDDGHAYTAPVGSYPAGASWVEASDMSGNVWEWTASWYDEAQTWRVLRGGSFYLNADYARAASRYDHVPGYRGNYLGFRVVVVLRSPSHQPDL